MRLFVRSRRLGSLKVLPGRTGTSEARVKKPSLAGGHWQRVGRAAFLCAGAATDARLHAPRTMCRGGMRAGRTLGPIRRLRNQRPYASSFINTRPAVSRLPAAPRRRPARAPRSHSNKNCICTKPSVLSLLKKHRYK